MPSAVRKFLPDLNILELCKLQQNVHGVIYMCHKQFLPLGNTVGRKILPKQLRVKKGCCDAGRLGTVFTCDSCLLVESYSMCLVCSVC